MVETHKIKSGCKIVGEAADGRKGCEIIVKERPDLIIMDLELPGKNGLPLLKKIRSEQIHSRVLVITKIMILTGQDRQLVLEWTNIC